MDTNPAGAGRPQAPSSDDLRILEDQLARMRGMLFGYSERFFERIRTYLLIVLAMLVIAGSGIFPSAVIAVPFLVPFAFLETGYLFFYTVFARRHAEYLERAINERLGRDVLVALAEARMRHHVLRSLVTNGVLPTPPRPMRRP